MLKHYVKVALRLIRRSFLFSSINMLGFVLGMTAAFLIYLWIVDELTFEDFNKNGDSIYRVIREEATGGKQISSTVVPLCRIFREEFPKVENATFIKYGGKLDLHLGEKFIEPSYAFVDTAFFDVFSFPVIAGDPNLMKHDPQQLVLSEATAKKLFGDTSPIGKEVVCRYFTNPKYYKVAAVLEVPRKSHIQFEVLGSWDSYVWGDFDSMKWDFSESMHVYIQLRKDNVLSDADRLAMRDLWVKHSQRGKPLAFQPLKHIHLRTTFKEPNDVNNHGSMQQIYLFAILAALIIFMGAFNFMTLSTARASQRFKEIGVRKVNGAHSDRIVRMFCREYMNWVGVAFLIACPLGYLFMLSWLSNFAYQTTISWWLFPLAGGIILLITILTVVAQTWRAASRNPVESLRYE